MTMKQPETGVFGKIAPINTLRQPKLEGWTGRVTGTRHLEVGDSDFEQTDP